MANNAVIDAIGTGDIVVNALVGGRIVPTTLEGVLHVPDLAANLLSQDQLVYESKLAIQHDSERGLRITNRNGVIVGTTSRINRQQILDTSDSAYMAKQSKRLKIDHNAADIQTWHECLGYLHYNIIRKLANGYTTGISIKGSGKLQTLCISCLYGKQYRKPNKTPARQCPERLNLIHTDVCGPINIPSLLG